MGIPAPIEVASLGMADSLILMVLALVVFGPRRLPQIGRQIGKLMYEFRKASNDFKFQMEEELRLAEEADRRKREEEERKRVAALSAATQASVSAPPAQTIESQADIGAVEAPAPLEAGAATDTGPGGPGAIENLEPADALRLQPPVTGEQVSAARPSRGTVAHDLIPETSSSVTGNGAIPETEPHAADGMAAGDEGASQADSESDSRPKEPVTQHG